MLIVSGVLGLMQSVLLPGLIIVKLGKLRGGLVEQLLRLFPLSLISSYLLVFLLTALHIYTKPVMLGVILFEILWILLLYRKTLFRPFSENAAALSEVLRTELKPLGEFLGQTRDLAAWIWVAAGCFALSGVLWGLHLCRLNFGTVFSGWDTLFSWNAYAETWAEGSIPRIGGMYPQLVASNWSISYLLQGEGAVQFFNTLLPPLFFLMIQVMLFDLGFQRRECGFFLAAIISRYMMKKLMGDQLFDGYMDVPAAAMSLLSFYTYLKAEERDLSGQRQGVILSVLFAAGAAITKQSGIAALAVAPLAVVILLRNAWKSLSPRQKLMLIGAVLILVVPWYIYCLLFSAQGTERELIADGIKDFNRMYDIRHRLRLAADTLGKYGLCFLLSLIAMPFIPRRYRWLFFLMSWPLTVIWAINYSYDARNLGPVLPFISRMCGLGLAGIGSVIRALAAKSGCGKIPLLPVLVLITAAGMFLLLRIYPDTRLKEDQRVRQQALFGERLNRELLYGVFGNTHEGHDIYTDYPARFLSGYADCCTSAELTDETQVRDVLEGDLINWLLIPQVMPNNSDPSKELIEQCINSGSCELIGCSDGYYKSYCLYERRH